ncbi:MAG: DUF6353 family protein, partial [Lachnospiraceae bacterium]|nr:DUF6353 family protein [Lachnospiraceae bacterium]
DTINTRRNTALAAAYALSLQDFADYKRKALEVVGEKKEEQIRDEVNKEKLIKDNVKDMPIIHTSGSGGKIPCYDPLSKRLFESDMETLRSAVNTLNTRIIDEMYITLNEYYAEIGLDPLSDCIGESMGWDLEHGQIKPQFTSQLVNGVPYLVIGHNNPPHYMR